MTTNTLSNELELEAFKAGYWLAYRAFHEKEAQYAINLAHPDRWFNIMFDLHKDDELFPKENE